MDEASGTESRAYGQSRAPETAQSEDASPGRRGAAPPCPCGSEEAVANVLRAAEEACRRTGNRATKLRLEVLSSLAASPVPLGAYALLARLNRTRTERPLAPASAYRVLKFWEELDLAHRLASGQLWVACAHPPHRALPAEAAAPWASGGFLLCRGCGHAHEFQTGPLATAAAEIAGRHGFALAGAVLELSGTCAACARRG